MRSHATHQPLQMLQAQEESLSGPRAAVFKGKGTDSARCGKQATAPLVSDRSVFRCQLGCLCKNGSNSQGPLCHQGVGPMIAHSSCFYLLQKQLSGKACSPAFILSLLFGSQSCLHGDNVICYLLGRLLGSWELFVGALLFIIYSETLPRVKGSALNNFPATTVVPWDSPGESVLLQVVVFKLSLLQGCWEPSCHRLRT